ncbi:hypothetical protein [Virgibacillus siamensis]|uniref:hypothetical protein n=1 Tax=Virgibacillus siamensis TaxID=480071 RepID=UPI0009845653|nr:hypothetical protein [Virgibacillus siamensis]
MNENIILTAGKDKGMLYDSFRALSEQDKLHWQTTHTKPISTLRKQIMQEKAERGTSISKGKLENYLLRKGTSLQEMDQLEHISMDALHEKSLKMNRGAIEVQFAGSAILEGFFELFGLTTHKALQRYENQVHCLKTEQGYYLGKVQHDGSMNKLTTYLTKQNAEKRLKEMEDLKQGQKQHFELNRTIKREDDQ